MRIGAIVLGLTILMAQASVRAQATRPASSEPMPAQQMLNQMLSRSSSSGAKPLVPTSQPGIDTTTGLGAVAPGAQPLTVLREGTYLTDRTGRLTRSSDGQQWEFTLEADGRAMKDPPVIILPNLKLKKMEEAVKGTNRDLRFRVTGMVTEYNGRNYILIDKATVPPDPTMQF